MLGLEPSLNVYKTSVLTHLLHPHLAEDREHDSHTFNRTDCLANSVVDLYNLSSKFPDLARDTHRIARPPDNDSGILVLETNVLPITLRTHFVVSVGVEPTFPILSG